MKELNRQSHAGNALSVFLVAVCAAQPLLDVISYWVQDTRYGTMLTTFLRALMLIGILLYAFCLSDRKKVYLIAGAVCAAVYAGHLFAIWQAEPLTGTLVFTDFANYMRVVQMPLFTLAFITFLKRSEDGFSQIQKGMLIAFFFIAAVELLSAVTGTNPYTYPNKAIGLLGWFYFANSQSAVLSMLFPFVLYTAVRREKLWLIIVVCIIGFGELFLFATRLAYFAIFAIALGMLLTLAITKKLKLKIILPILLCAAVCAACYNISPMSENRRRVFGNEQIKQSEIDRLVEEGTQEFGAEGCEYLTYAYEEYLGGMVDRFGLEKTAKVFDYSTSKDDIANVRTLKINYCKLLLSESPTSSSLFGLSYGSMTYQDYCYDVENDLHGIRYLYGWAGLAALVAFLLYFAFLVFRALLKDFRASFTLETGICGISVCLGLVHAYCTAGVLRRPNASFYLSVALALIWYFIHNLQRNASKEN